MKRLFYTLAVIPMVFVSHPGRTQEYKNTTVTPHLAVTINDNENVIYTSSFHLAWKMLENDILKSEVKIKENIPLVDHLNQTEPTPINEQYSLNLAGFVKDGIDIKISDELKRKFSRNIDLSKYTHDPTNIICYSFFQRNIRFKTKFETFEQSFPFFGGGRQYEVECFGIWTAGDSEQHQGIRELVNVMDHKSINDFIISISNPGEDDEIIIAVCDPAVTLGETIDVVNQRIKNSKPESLVNNDRLIIPKVSIDAQEKYFELYGIHLANRDFEDYFFTEAVHDISFELNESGAYADSEAKIMLEKGPGPRTMIINHPFLIMMKERNSDKPYFAAWIADPEVLVRPD